MRKILFLIFCSIFLISGCGSSGGGAVFFESVMITAYSEITGLDSDIMVWKLKDPNGVCAGYETRPDLVNITIKSEVFPVNELGPSSPVKIENVRIDYEPVSNTPSLASYFQELGQIVEPNGEVSLEIFVMHTEQKSHFLDDPNHYTAIIMNKAFYTYNLTLTFSVVEITTDEKGEVTTGLTIKIHDYICEEGEGITCDDDCSRDPNRFRP